MNLAESLLRALHDHGAREIFGIPGDFALPFFKVIETSGILPLYTLSHEPGVGFAADAAGVRRSHMLGAAAVKAGKFAAEIEPLTVMAGRKEVVVSTDDHIKPETTIEGLRALRAAFGKDGTVTAGNASGIVDGAAMLVVTTGQRAKELGLQPKVRIRSWAIAGVPPEVMGLGPVPAIRQAVDKAGLKVGDLDLIEINEAFSAQYLGCEKELGLDRDKCNVNGGAIALGHPLGATGTRLLLTLMRELEESKKSLGCASACIGGGQGIAMILERV